MSHVCKIELEIRDLEALERAVKMLGLDLVKGQTSYRWYGNYPGLSVSAAAAQGSYTLPAGFTINDLGHCAHAIVDPANREGWEIGVAQRRDGKPGFILLMESMINSQSIGQRIGKAGARLKQEYSAAVATAWYGKQGYRVNRTVTQDGRIILEGVR